MQRAGLARNSTPLTRSPGRPPQRRCVRREPYHAILRTGMSPTITLRQLSGRYAACRLDASAAVPPWADGDGFVSITRTLEELSIVCRSERVPAGITASREWTCFQFVGPFAFDET